MTAAPVQRTVLLVSAFDAPFIGEDAEILSTRYRLLRSTGSGPAALLRVLPLVFRCGLVFSWFLSVVGAFAVLAARLAGRPAVIVMGGVDAAADRSLGYGFWLSPMKAAVGRLALRSATRVLVVDESLREKAMRFGSYDGGNILCLPTGFDPETWTPGGEKGRDVLCVASASDDTRFMVKGIDVLIGAARELPENDFTVVGVSPELAARFGPPGNMTFLDPVPRKDLLPLYRSARVYCQPSRHEGLPNALCEAMLCACVPVAADTGGCRTAVGETGFIVPPADHRSLAGAIREALRGGEGRSGDPRGRIVGMFHINRRRQELHRIVEDAFEHTAAVS